MLIKAKFLTRNRQDADDLVQVTYLQALRDWGSFTRDAGPVEERARTWLHGILYHRYLDSRKRARTRREFVRRVYGFTDDAVVGLGARCAGERAGAGARGTCAVPASQVAPDEAVLSPGVARAIEQLSEEQREVIVRIYFCGDTYTEVAADLGIGLDAVKARLWRARRVLAALLAR